MKSNNIHALRQRKIDLTKTNQALLDKAAAENRNLSAEEEREFSARMIELKKNDVAIAEKEAELDAERGLVGSDHPNTLAAIAAGAPGHDGRLPRRPAAGPRFRQMFPSLTLSDGGFQSFNDFLGAFHNSQTIFDPRLQAAQREAIPSDGGFAVPSQYAAQILDQALESEIVRPRAQIWPMTSDTRKVPAVDSFDHSANINGFSAQWIGELGTITDATMKLRLMEIHANKFALLGQASNELLADAGDYENVYGAKMTAAASWFLDYAFLQADGVGKPLGVLNDPALITVSKESGQLANTILYENVSNMLARLHPSCFANAIWVCNSTALPQLLRMQLVVKNVAGTENVGGSATPVFSQLADGTFRLLTRPLIFTEKLPQLSSKGDIVLADFSQYAVGMRKEISLDRSAHVGFTNDSTWFRIITRLDGQGVWKAPVTPKNGSSQSWCVTLQAR
jgi:HK97 family phage major capsid protein